MNRQRRPSPHQASDDPSVTATSLGARRHGPGHRLSTALVAASGLLAASAPARASGRGLGTTAFVFDPNDPTVIYARLSFGYGLVVSRDAGASWRWICGLATGTTETDDPTYVITPKGTLVGATLAGVTVSRDRGCSFSFVGGRGAYPLVHLAMRPNGELLGVSSSGDHRFVISTDDARSFTTMAAPLDVELERVAAAPSDPGRLYLSGARGKDPAALPGQDTQRIAALFVSYDGARSWTERKLDASFEHAGTLVLTVDPTNADRVYVWTMNPPSRARVLVTDDAGRTWRQAWSSEHWISDLALSADGRRLFVRTDTDEGLAVGTTDTFAFATLSSAPGRALGLSGSVLWVGGDGLTRSRDDGRHFDHELSLRDTQGPIDCPAGSSTAQVCGSEWPTFRQLHGWNATTDGLPIEAIQGPESQKDKTWGVDIGLWGIAALGVVGYLLWQRGRRS